MLTLQSSRESPCRPLALAADENYLARKKCIEGAATHGKLKRLTVESTLQREKCLLSIKPNGGIHQVSPSCSVGRTYGPPPQTHRSLGLEREAGAINYNCEACFILNWLDRRGMGHHNTTARKPCTHYWNKRLMFVQKVKTYSNSGTFFVLG